MSRACHDCGIADWQPCQCDPRAGLDGPDPRNFRLPRPDEDEQHGEVKPDAMQRH